MRVQRRWTTMMRRGVGGALVLALCAGLVAGGGSATAEERRPAAAQAEPRSPAPEGRPDQAVGETICTDTTLDYRMQANIYTQWPFYIQRWPGGTGTVGEASCQVRVTEPSDNIILIGGLPGVDRWRAAPVAGSGIASVAIRPQSPNCTLFLAISNVTADRPSCSVGSSLSSTERPSAAVLTIDVTANPVLTVERRGAGTGSVVSSVAGISCGTDCVQQYPRDLPVTLSATPAAGSTFVGWAGAGPSCAGAPTCEVTMSASRTVTAEFASTGRYGLSVTKGGAGRGTISSVPGGIECGVDCDNDSATFDRGSLVELRAAAESDSVFTGWAGDGTCTGVGPCTVSMDGNHAVVANFTRAAPAPVSLAVTRDGAGSGTVTSDPAGIDCGTTCVASFVPRTVVRLTARAARGSRFAGWSAGACAGTAACSVEAGSVREVTARFDPSVYRPDGRIRASVGRAVGDGIYNSTARRQTRGAAVRRGRATTFAWSVQNDGDSPDRLALSSSVNPGRGFRVVYRIGSRVVTREVVAGTLVRRVGPGRQLRVDVTVRVTRGAARASVKRVLLRATSRGDASKQDAVRASVTAR